MGMNEKRSRRSAPRSTAAMGSLCLFLVFFIAYPPGIHARQSNCELYINETHTILDSSWDLVFFLTSVTEPLEDITPPNSEYYIFPKTENTKNVQGGDDYIGVVFDPTQQTLTLKTLDQFPNLKKNSEYAQLFEVPMSFDCDEGTSTISALIQLTDSNMFAPEMNSTEETYHLTMPISNGYTLTNLQPISGVDYDFTTTLIQATLPDDMNEIFSVAVRGNYRSGFNVDLTTKKEVSWEEERRFDITIRDFGTSEDRTEKTSTVSIVIVPDRENSVYNPRFKKPIYTDTISTAQAGSTLLSIGAEDFEEGYNDELQYYLEDGGSHDGEQAVNFIEVVQSPNGATIRWKNDIENKEDQLENFLQKAFAILILTVENPKARLSGRTILHFALPGSNPDEPTTPEPCPTTVTPTECPICTTPEPCPTTETPTECPTPEPCPTTETPTECPTPEPCPTTETPTECPTPEPCPTTETPTECPICTTPEPCPTTETPTECPTPEPCPTTETPTECPTPEPCPTTVTQTECPTSCPTPTECPTEGTPSSQIPTECPACPTESTSVCPLTCPPVTDCPVPTESTTACPVCPTECPQTTECPEVPTGNTTVCPPCPTDNPSVTDCPEIPTESTTVCPVFPTDCPSTTESPEVPTDNTTVCPVCPTECPLTTESPEVPTTVCPPCPTDNPSVTQCPEIPTESTTVCPACPTECALTTECPEVPTDYTSVCPPCTTNNPSVTECPGEGSTSCPPCTECPPTEPGSTTCAPCPTLWPSTTDPGPGNILEFEKDYYLRGINMNEESKIIEHVQLKKPMDGVVYSLTAGSSATPETALSINGEGQVYLNYPPPIGSNLYYVHAKVTGYGYGEVELIVQVSSIWGNGNESSRFTDALTAKFVKEHETKPVWSTANDPKCTLNMPESNKYFELRGWEVWPTELLDREDPEFEGAEEPVVKFTLQMTCEDDGDEDGEDGEDGAVALQQTPRNTGENVIGRVLYNPNETVLAFKIQDINDNFPSFIINSMIMGYPESDVTSQLRIPELMIAEATDPDIGVNAEIQYSLNERGAAKFEVNAATGAVYPRSDVAPPDDGYTFQIHASDGENVEDVPEEQKRAATLDVTVRILKVNHLVELVVENALPSNLNHLLEEAGKKGGRELRALTVTVLPGVGEGNDGGDGDGSGEEEGDGDGEGDGEGEGQDGSRVRRSVSKDQDEAKPRTALRAIIYSIKEQKPEDREDFASDLRDFIEEEGFDTKAEVPDFSGNNGGGDSGLLVAVIVLGVFLGISVFVAAGFAGYSYGLRRKYGDKNEMESNYDNSSDASSTHSVVGIEPLSEDMLHRNEKQELEEQRINPNLNIPSDLELPRPTILLDQMARGSESSSDDTRMIEEAPSEVGTVDTLNTFETSSSFVLAPVKSSPKKSVVTFNEDVDTIEIRL